MSILPDRDASFFVLLPALLMLGGCAAGDASNGEWACTVADSAGISVVTNPAGGLWRASEAWVPVEDLAITDRSFPEIHFGEITDLAVDANGRILVLDAMSRTYHAFGADGAHLFTAGKPGSGPGEFAVPVQILVLPGDSVLVTDLGNSRASIFAPDGSPSRTIPLDFLDLAAQQWAVAGDGSVVARRAASEADMIVRVEASGEVVDTVVHLATPPRPAGSDGRPVLLNPVPVWTVLPTNGVVHGDSHRYRITVTEGTGEARLVFSRPVDPEPLTSSGREVIREAFRAVLAEQGAPKEVADDFFRQVAFWEELPLIAGILSGPEGTYWVQRAAGLEAIRFDRLNIYRTDAFLSATWDVFDSEGRFLGTIRFPDEVQLFRIRDGLLYGVRLDEFDVPSVVRFRLERGAEGA
jgi:hypothetical protein